jgi:hypothetical protein
MNYKKSVLPESPRWLLSKNRQDEALEIIKNVAKTNKKELNLETWNSLVEKQNVIINYIYCIILNFHQVFSD